MVFCKIRLVRLVANQTDGVKTNRSVEWCVCVTILISTLSIGGGRGIGGRSRQFLRFRVIYAKRHSFVRKTVVKEISPTRTDCRSLRRRRLKEYSFNINARDCPSDTVLPMGGLVVTRDNPHTTLDYDCTPMDTWWWRRFIIASMRKR